MSKNGENRSCPRAEVSCASGSVARHARHSEENCQAAIDEFRQLLAKSPDDQTLLHHLARGASPPRDSRIREASAAPRDRARDSGFTSILRRRCACMTDVSRPRINHWASCCPTGGDCSSTGFPRPTSGRPPLSSHFPSQSPSRAFLPFSPKLMVTHNPAHASCLQYRAVSMSDACSRPESPPKSSPPRPQHAPSQAQLTGAAEDFARAADHWERLAARERAGEATIGEVRQQPALAAMHCLNEAAICEWDLGKSDRAKELLKRAIAIRRTLPTARWFNFGSPPTFTASDTLASVLEAENNFEEARRIRTDLLVRSIRLSKNCRRTPTARSFRRRSTACWRTESAAPALEPHELLLHTRNLRSRDAVPRNESTPCDEPMRSGTSPARSVRPVAGASRPDSFRAVSRDVPDQEWTARGSAPRLPERCQSQQDHRQYCA